MFRLIGWIAEVVFLTSLTVVATAAIIFAIRPELLLLAAVFLGLPS